MEPLLLSLKVACAALFLHLVFGVAIGYLLSRKKLVFRGVLDALVTLPLVFPPIATGFFLLLLLGRSGWIGSVLEAWGIEVIFGFWGVLIAAFVAGLPLMVKPVQSAIESVSSVYEEASYVLGKGRLRTFLCVILPNIKRSLLAGAILSFGRSLGEVGITLMLGGNIIGRTETISLAIYNAVFSGEFERAMLLSVALGGFSLAVFFILRRLSAL